MPTFGPGTLKIGATGTEIDVSCLVNSLKITASKDEGDSTTKLCGTVKPGKVTYTYAMEGNLDIDTEDADAGLFALSQASPGSQQPFTYTPNTADGTTASGTLVIDPLDFGGDEFGDDMNSDISFTLVGPPTYVYGTAETVEASSRFTPLVINGKNAAAQPAVVAQPAPAKADAEPEPERELATSSKK